MERQRGIIHFLNADMVFLITCIFFSVMMLIQTKQLRDESAILVPRLFGILAIIFALSAILIRTIEFLKRGREELKEKVGSPAHIETEGAMSLYIAVALSVIYLVLTEIIGFIVGTIITILAFLWFAKYRGLILGLVYSIITTLILYLLFYNVLKVNLPRGIIF